MPRIRSLCRLTLVWLAALTAEAATNLWAPLSVRGVNYFPRETPWGGMWTRTSNEVFAADMRKVAELRANTIRTFVTFNDKQVKSGLLLPDGRPAALYFERIDALLSAADSNGIRAILSLEFDAQFRAEPKRWRTGLRALVERYRGDPRVTCWDAMNEPDDESKWNEATREYLRGALPLLRELAPAQPVTVGLAFRTDRLREVGIPDVLQYHEYAPKDDVFGQGVPRIIKSLRHQIGIAPGRPLLVGEFGMSTARDPRFGAPERLRSRIGVAPGTEAEQARLYETVLAACEAERVAGALAWCLHDYPINNPDEAYFGLFRLDGSLKPAGEVLRQAFTRWADLVRAP